MNTFGGNWTDHKIDILVEYASAYLKIMNIHAHKYNWKLLYFDGFAGSGEIAKGKKENQRIIIGAARRIIELSEPRSFDNYYFVDKNKENLEKLEKHLSSVPNRKIQYQEEDCNVKIQALGEFLKSDQGKKFKVLAYLDPYGMQLSFKSIMALKEAKIDAWILVPTGLGVNRLLKKDGKISDAWKAKLADFLGMHESEVLEHFYKETRTPTLFGDEETKINKEEKAINKAAELYKNRLGELFKFVSNPYALRNKSNSTMFHFIMVSNNPTAVKIANEIINNFTYNK